MNHTKRLFSILTILMIFASGMMGQQPVSIVYQGTLTDMEGDVITGKKIRADMAFLDTEGNTIYSFFKETAVDDYGTFGIEAENIPEWVLEGKTHLIRISLFSMGEDDWLMDGKFDLDYTLIDESAGDEHAFVMKRFEGLILDAVNEGELWQFTDLYPFAYLSSRFMISFNKEISDPEDIQILCNEFFNEPAWKEDAMMEKASEEGMAPVEAPKARSRGIKGGYAVGGYHDDDDK
jgi:hypothetical protein